MNRRGVLGAMAGAGVFGPKAAKAAAQRITWERGLPPATPPTSPYPSGFAGETNTVQGVPYVDMHKPEHWLRVLANPELRGEIESALYEQQRNVTWSVDPDIAVHRSVSQMAKLAYQRQRNVAKAMKARSEETPYSKITGKLKRFFGMQVGGFSLFD